MKTYTEEYYSQGKRVTHGKGEIYVLGTEGHIPLCSPLAKTNEHNAWNRKREPKASFFILQKKLRGKEGDRERKRK